MIKINNSLSLLVPKKISFTTGLIILTLVFASCGKDDNEGVINDVFFGSEVSATKLPTLKTNEVSNIIMSSANCGGFISTKGESNVTSRGVCWSTNPSPTVDNSFTVNGSGTGSFYSEITGLASNTLYYVRAYATNSYGTSYGNEVNFRSATYTTTIPTNGLIARYPLNGTTADISGNSLHGIPHNVYQTNDRFGKAASAALFSGASNSWIEVTHSAQLNLGVNFTISAWIYKESGSSHYVLGKGRDISCGTYTLGTEGISANGSCGTSASNTNTLPLNEWFLLTGIMDGTSGKLRFYQNGQLIKEVVCNPFTSNNNYPLAIGRHVTTIPASDSDPYSYPFKGKIDDVLIYNRALTNTEVMQIYNAVE